MKCTDMLLAVLTKHEFKKLIKHKYIHKMNIIVDNLSLSLAAPIYELLFII